MCDFDCVCMCVCGASSFNIFSSLCLSEQRGHFDQSVIGTAAA